jgi:hypothetical protein
MTVANIKAKANKLAGSSFDLPNSGIPKFPVEDGNAGGVPRTR